MIETKLSKIYVGYKYFKVTLIFYLNIFSHVCIL